MALARDVYRLTETFPKGELFGLTNQIRRAAVSIPSNIAEGRGRLTRKTFVLFLSQARGSLYELETQIELARDLGFMAESQADSVIADAGEISRMLHCLMARMRQEGGD